MFLLYDCLSVSVMFLFSVLFVCFLRFYTFIISVELVTIQGGPAKVKPTYIFAGNVWHLNV